MVSPSGILVLHKPAGITSRDAVDFACKRLRTREIGHCGTLDPLATGVLVLVVGRARRLQDLLSRSRKEYAAEIRLGAVSETDDAEGPLHETPDPGPPPAEEAVRGALRSFVGEIEQRPPRFSAVKVEGKRLYELARKGQDVEPPLRTVRVFSIELLHYEYPVVKVVICCAGGTYVRSIARDLGAALGTGGYLAGLCRTGSGAFTLEHAADPETLDRDDVLPLEEALRQFPRVDIAAAQARRLANGADVVADTGQFSLDQEETIFGWLNQRAVAILKKTAPGKVRSARLLVTPEELYELADQELRAEDQRSGRPAYHRSYALGAE
jgi:tRNA pseudouridine55 synthase